MNADDSALVDRFLDMMAAEAGASRNTLSAYRSDLSTAAAALPGGLSKASLEDLGRLAPAWADVAASTLARRSAALRRFYGFLHEEGIRNDDPSVSLARPRQQRPLPRILDTQEVEKLFVVAEQRAASGQPEALRNLALLSCSTAPVFGRVNW